MPKQINITTWSHPTWTLLHTLAEKVKPAHFLKIRKRLFWIVSNICHTLPCPECRKHASEFNKKIKYKNIKTKEQFKYVIFVFHNTVNKRLKKAIFNEKDLNERYSKERIGPAIRGFLRIYNMNTRIRSDMHNSMARNMVSKQLISWFNKNLNKFS